MSASPERGLWRHADFKRLWAAQAISAYGSRITRTALPIIAVQTLGEPEAIVGLLAALQLAPGVVLAMFAGGFVDRGRKRRILIGADLARAALVASLTIAWAVGVLSVTHVVIVGAVVGAASALFQLTDVAYLPALIGKRDLAEGNAKLETTEAIAEISGPASAGALIAAFGAPFAVALDAASYLWSAFMLGRIRTEDVAAVRRDAIVGDDDNDDVPAAWEMRDLRVGLRAVFEHPNVRPLVLSQMVWSVAGGFFSTTYTLYCLRTLAMSDTAFGVIIAMGGVGSLGGALMSRVLVTKLGLGRTLLATSVLSMSCALFIPIAGMTGASFAMFGFLAAHQLLGDGFGVAFLIQSVTLRQTVLRRDVLGRANAAMHVVTAGIVPVAALGAGLIAQVAGIRTAMWIGVLIGLLVPVLLWPLRRLVVMPEAAVSGPIHQVNPASTKL